MDYRFEFAENNKVWWPVKIPVPQNGGTTTMFEMQMLIEVHTKDQSEAITKLPDKEQADAILARVHDWKGLPLTGGKDVPFSKDALKALINKKNAELALALAFRQVDTGVAAKN